MSEKEREVKKVYVAEVLKMYSKIAAIYLAAFVAIIVIGAVSFLLWYKLTTLDVLYFIGGYAIFGTFVDLVLLTKINEIADNFKKKETKRIHKFVRRLAARAM